jgi:hypothetical protein
MARNKQKAATSAAAVDSSTTTTSKRGPPSNNPIERLRALRWRLAQRVDDHFHRADNDKSGYVSFEQFERSFGDDSADSAVLRNLFSELDVNKDGKVTLTY